MYAIRSYYAPVGAAEMNESMLGARTFCAAGFEPVNFVSGNFRITSYNVCYTKLLRQHALVHLRSAYRRLKLVVDSPVSTI